MKIGIIGAMEKEIEALRADMTEKTTRVISGMRFDEGKLCGRDVVLAYTVNSMCAVEDRAGGALDGLMEKQFSAARLLLWGGMIERQPETTLAEAGVRISEHMARGGTLEQVIDMCAEALRRAGFFGPAA